MTPVLLFFGSAGLFVWLFYKWTSRRKMTITVAFEIGEPHTWEFRGNDKELLVMAHHIPKVGSQFAGRKVWKVHTKIE